MSVLGKLIVVFVSFSVIFPGFSDQIRTPLRRNYTDYRSYVVDTLLFLKNIETKSFGDDLEMESSTDHLGRRKKLFAPSNTALLKDIFENNRELSHWMRTSAGPLFSAIQADNVDMIQFFEQKQESVLLKKYGGLYAVQSAVIVPSLNAIRYFFNHPTIDLNVVNMFGDNLFHLIFLGAGMPKSKRAVLQIFFHGDYFPKVAHLLNKPNSDGEAPLDFSLREDKGELKEKIILGMLEKEAIALVQTELLKEFDKSREEKLKRQKKAKPEQESRYIGFTVGEGEKINVNGILMTERELEEQISRNKELDRETVRMLEQGRRQRREGRERREGRRVEQEGRRADRRKNEPETKLVRSTCPGTF